MDIDDYSVDYYKELNRVETPQAARLAYQILQLYWPKGVIDFGCATGLYLRPFTHLGVKILGIELSPNALHPDVVTIDPKEIMQLDLRLPLPKVLAIKDVGICLEVLEHIKKEYTDQAVENICTFAKLLVVSIAKPNQPGEHHHTLMPKAWWLEKFARHGFYVDLSDTFKIFDYLEKGEHTNWIDNILVLKHD